MIRLLLASLLLFGLSARGESDYTKWLKARNIAEQAWNNADFNGAREALESVASIVGGIGQEATAEHSYFLARIFLVQKKYTEAHAVVMAGLEKIGPNPIAHKSQGLRGYLLATQGVIYYETKNYDDALATTEKARDTLELAMGKYHPRLYALHQLIGSIEFRKTNYAVAEASFKRALRAAEGANMYYRGPVRRPQIADIGSTDDGVADATLGLGLVCLAGERYKEATTYANKAVKAAELAFGKKAPNVVVALAFAARVNLKTHDQKQFIANTDRIAEIAALRPQYEIQKLNVKIAEPLWIRFETEFYDTAKTIPEATLGKLVAVYGGQDFDFSELAKRVQKIAVHDEARLPQIQDAVRRQIQAKLPGNPDKLIAVENVFSGKNVMETSAAPSPVSKPQSQP